jgi:hypothetical protein
MGAAIPGSRSTSRARSCRVGTIVEVAAAAVCLGVVVCAVTAAFLSTTAVSGLETGSFKLGLRAGLIAAATAVAFWEVGNLTNAIAGVDPYGPHIQPQIGTPEYAFNVTAHAAVGCASALASGGKCGPSALAGGVTSAAGRAIPSPAPVILRKPDRANISN